MGKRDRARTLRGNGYVPLTFNFIKNKDGKYIQCAYCGKFIYYRRITRDHIYPKSKGGILKAPACYPCNEAKEDMRPIEWAVYASKHRIDLAVIPIGADFLSCEEDKEQLYADLTYLFERVLTRKFKDAMAEIIDEYYDAFEQLRVS